LLSPSCPTGIEERADIVDEPHPARRRRVAQRAIRVQPGEPLSPFARDVGIEFDDSGALSTGILTLVLTL
jgi:hypothetical protein